jgi:hypothetical protein
MNKNIPATTPHRFLPRVVRFTRNAALALLCLAGILPTTQAAKVLYVSTGLLPSGAKMVSILRAQGHDVTVLTAGNALTATNYASQGYQLLIVDEVISSGVVANRFRGSPIPVINWEAYIYNGSRSAFNADSGLVGANYADGATAAAVNGGLGADFGQVINQTKIEIVDPAHPLAAGLGAGLVDVFDPAATGPFVDNNGPGVISFAGTRTFTPNVQVVATTPDFSEGMAVWGILAGATLADSTVSQARWVHLPWNTTAPQRTLIEPSYFLFEAGVAWALTNAQPVKIYNLAPEGGSFIPTNTIVSCAINKTNNAGSAVASGNIVVKVNGATATSGVSITDGGTVWNVSYTNGFAVDKTVTVTFSATSADGGLGARQTTFDTYSTSNFTWEAEDFNFGGGSFFDTIVLCTNFGGATPNCYFDRVGVTNVDQNELNFTVTIAVPTTNEVYRFGDLADTVRDEYVDTYLTTDSFVRGQYVTASIPDYEVRNIAVNEWLNYTRTYPPGTYNIYARVASAAAMTVQLDFVDNGSNTVQNLTKIGRFVKPAGTAGYEFVPLTDDLGVTTLVVALTNTGPITIRSTALSAGYTPNYYMLVPTAAPVNQSPVVDITSLATNLIVYEGTSTNIEATVTDDGTITNVAFYAGAAEPLTLLGNDTTAPFSFPYSPGVSGSNITYTTLRVIATDNGGLSAQDSLQVRTVAAGLILLSPVADAQLNEYNAAVQDTSGNGTQLNARTSNTGYDPGTNTAGVNEVFALRYNLGAYQGQNLQDVSLNLVNFRGNNADVLHYYGVADNTVGLDNNGTTPGFTDDTWNESDAGGNATNLLKYSTMPGLYFDGTPSQGYDTNNVTNLGAATMASGNKAVVVTYSSSALESFVESHPDNLVTILVDTDTQGTGQKRFASKEASALDGSSPAGAVGDYAPILAFRLAPATPPTLSYTVSGGNLTLSWTQPGYKLIAQTNTLSTGLTATWADYPGGGSSPVVVPIDTTKGTVFFGLAPTP